MSRMDRFKTALSESRIPQRMHHALIAYVESGEEPGDFLYAVLSDSLSDAVGRADGENSTLLPEYVRFIYNHAPSECWGSPSEVDAWILHFQKPLKEPVSDGAEDAEECEHEFDSSEGGTCIECGADGHDALSGRAEDAAEGER